jgi:hypothetical protein
VSTVKVLVEEATLCQTLHLRWMGEGVLTQGVSTVKVLVEEATLCQTLHLRWMGEGVLTQGVSTVKVLVEEATLCQTLHLRWMGEGVLTQGVSTVKVMLVSAAHCRAHAHGLTVSESHGIRYIASYVVSLLPTTGCESKPTPGRIAGRGGLSDSQAQRQYQPESPTFKCHSLARQETGARTTSGGAGDEGDDGRGGLSASSSVPTRPMKYDSGRSATPPSPPVPCAYTHASSTCNTIHSLGTSVRFQQAP